MFGNRKISGQVFESQIQQTFLHGYVDPSIFRNINPTRNYPCRHLTKKPMTLLGKNFTLLLFASLILFSCKDDDGPGKTIDNNFSLGERNFDITSAGFVIDSDPGTDGDGDEYYRNELFFSEGISLGTGGGEPSPSGTGHYISLLINNEGQELEPGTYTWQSEENEQPFDLWAAYLTTDWHTETQTDYELVSGTLTVTKSGNIYTIDFEGVAYQEGEEGEQLPDTDEIVTVKFKGSLAQFERDF